MRYWRDNVLDKCCIGVVGYWRVRNWIDEVLDWCGKVIIRYQNIKILKV